MKTIRENFIHVFIVFLELTFIFLISKRCYMIRDIDYLKLFLMSLAIVAISILIFIGLKSIYKHKAGRIVLWLSLISISIFCIRHSELILQSSLVKDIARINIEIGKGNSTYFKDYFGIFMAIGPVISLVLLYISKSSFLQILVMVNLGIYLFFYYVGYETEIERFRFLFGLISLFILYISGYRRYINKLKTKGIKLEINKLETIFKAIITLLIITTAFSLYVRRDKGVYYDELYAQVSSVLKGEGNEGSGISIDERGISKSGYIDTDKKLGGPLSISKDAVFKVYSNEGNVYLRGAVKDEYTGYSWRRSKKHEFINQRNLKAEEIINNKIKANGEKKVIKIETLNTGYDGYFVPINTINIKGSKFSGVYWNEENNLYISNKRVTSDYEVEYFDEPVINKFDYSLDGKKNDIYLNLPKSIPNRVHQLAKEITKNSKNDLEKVIQIRDYLSRNYAYDINVSNIPEGVDFVDYFLFSEKKGYCVYFATSFTVLARSVGIQARYVEGFKTTNDIQPEGYLEVTNEDAHAWAEVMLDPKLEQWSTIDCSATLRGGDQQKPNEQTTMSYDSKDMSGQQGNNENIKGKNENNKEFEDEANINKITEKKKLNIKGLRYPRRFLVSAFLSGILLFMILKLLKSITLVRRALDKKSVKPLYGYVLRRLKSVGYTKEKYETDMEFVNRINDKDIKGELTKLVNAVYKEFYGNEVGDFENRKEFLQKLEEYIKNRSGKVEYIVKRYYKN